MALPKINGTIPVMRPHPCCENPQTGRFPAGCYANKIAKGKYDFDSFLLLPCAYCRTQRGVRRDDSHSDGPSGPGSDLPSAVVLIHPNRKGPYFPTNISRTASPFGLSPSQFRSPPLVSRKFTVCSLRSISPFAFCISRIVLRGQKCFDLSQR